MAITDTKSCKHCGYSGPLNVLKIKQPGYGNQLHMIMYCPSCKKKMRGVTTLSAFNAADARDSIARCLVCNSPNVELMEDPLRAYQRYQNVSSLHVKLKYRCKDCNRMRVKVVPMMVMKKMYGPGAEPAKAEPGKIDVLDTCPFCSVGLEATSGKTTNFCDSCGQNLKCGKCGTYVVASGSQFCMSCGEKLTARAEPLAGEVPANQCPLCGTSIREGTLFCAECGGRIACDCGSIIDPTARFCGKCGKTFETD